MTIQNQNNSSNSSSSSNQPIRPVRPVRPIRPTRPEDTPPEPQTEGKATAFKNKTQARIRHLKQSGIFHSREYVELALLGLVLLFLAVSFLRADFIHKEETQRYQLEQHANTDTLKYQNIGGLLNGYCPNLSEQGFYRRSNKGYANASLCQSLSSPTEINKAYTDAVNKLTQINDAMIAFDAGSSDTRLKADEREELAHNAVDERKLQRHYWFRKQGHALNDDGAIGEIDLLLTGINQQQTDTATSSAPTSTNAIDANNKSTNNTQAMAMAMAALAVADGNRSFPYSQVFKDNPELQRRYNRIASDVYFIKDTNRNNAQNKPKLAKQLITPVMLLPVAFWQLAGWALLAWGSLALTRRITKPYAFLPILLVLWLGMAYVSPSILISQKLLLALVVLAAIISVLSYLPFSRKYLASKQHRWQLGSRFALPGFVLFIGIGLLIMLDLGGRGYLASRTEALRLLPLKHMRMIFWCFFTLSLLPSINYLLGSSLSNVFNTLTDKLFAKQTSSRTRWLSFAVFMVVAAGFFVFVLLFKNKAYIVAELLKFWLVFGLALYVVSRGNDSNEPSFLFSVRAIPLYVIMLVPILLLLITTEMGTLQVFVYAVAVFLGGFFAHVRKTHFNLQSKLMGTGLAIALMLGFTGCIALFGDAVASRAGDRIDMWLDPFNASNDQMAIIHWFRESTPFFGYGFGNVPWCGFNLGTCAGVPHQQQSDYTATSIIAVYGKLFSVLLLGLFCFWIGRMLTAQAKIHGHVQGMQGYPVNFAHSVLAWAGICWAVVALVQTFVTLFGNLGVIPLTGVTLPFLSYGDAALLMNTLFLALMINLPKKIADDTLVITD